MQRKLLFQQRSEDEEIKETGLTIDFDEIAKKGKMSKEEELIAKWFGIYSSRQPGNHMARVVIPGGQITSSQARLLARTAELYAQGKLSITTRQAIQMHWLKTPALPDMMREIAEDGLTTFHGCGDVTRNVTSCPLAETCQYARLNVLPYAQKTAKYLSDCRDLDNLPRKYKVTFSGCGANCAQPYINCFSAIAIDNNNTPGFKVVIGGGMGWKPFVAQELFSFVPPEIITPLSRAVALLFRDHGDRRDRRKSRLKFVVARYGIEKCREIVLKYLQEEKINTTGLKTNPITDTGKPYPQRPLVEPDPLGIDGNHTIQALIPKGELTHHEMKRLAELSEIFGNKHLYTTNRQNIAIHSVSPQNKELLKHEIHDLGFRTDGHDGLHDIVPCVGTKYCPKALSSTHDLYDQLMKIVQHKKYDPIRDNAIIHITGCPNSCSPYYIADIGFRGTRIRTATGSVEGYQMRVGGTQQRFGKIIGDFKTQDCPKALETILDTFLEYCHGEESLTDCFIRLEEAPPNQSS